MHTRIKHEEYCMYTLLTKTNSSNSLLQAHGLESPQLHGNLFEYTFVSLHPLPKFFRCLFPWIYDVWYRKSMHLLPHRLNRRTNQWIVRTSEHYRLNIRRELSNIPLQELINRLTRHNTLLNQWNHPSTRYLCDLYLVIQNMNTISVPTNLYGCLRSQDSYFFIPILHDAFRSRNRHTKNLSLRKYLLLKPPKCMHTRGIAG